MLEEFSIGSGGFAVAFSDPKYNQSSGWLENYLVTLQGPALSAIVRVENHPAGSDPSSFFGKLAESWQGWKGDKKWGSMEGELDLGARADSLGHVTIEVRVRPDAYPARWSASLSVEVDAGELERTHRLCKRFFARPEAQTAPEGYELPPVSRTPS